nr:immunoglobulin light chain junction region [Macaca mulatta]MOX37278.1 immunoglobulin light chain junction region [Macaca mulatta]MOX37443.1 immunoglobulin light chain junction region [Macaca mulatta]
DYYCATWDSSLSSGLF